MPDKLDLRKTSIKLRFDPAQWHACVGDDGSTCLKAANCYAYALNEPGYHWAVPGYGFCAEPADDFFKKFNNLFSGYSAEKFRQALIDGAVSDGLEIVDGIVVRDGYYMAALFFTDKAGDLDFHWYRQDDDGTWSHKNGWRAVTNKDDAGAMIVDPRLAKSTEFSIFGSYFLVPRAGVVLSKVFSD